MNAVVVLIVILATAIGVAIYTKRQDEIDE